MVGQQVWGVPVAWRQERAVPSTTLQVSTRVLNRMRAATGSQCSELLCLVNNVALLFSLQRIFTWYSWHSACSNHPALCVALCVTERVLLPRKSSCSLWKAKFILSMDVWSIKSCLWHWSGDMIMMRKKSMPVTFAPSYDSMIIWYNSIKAKNNMR